MSGKEHEELIGLKLLSVKQETKRTVFIFQDKDDEEKERKFSAFEPGVPDLQIGQYYDFEVEHVPRGDGTFYHNFVREYKDGPYLIRPSSISEKQAKKKFENAMKDPRENYWENKAKDDKITHAEIRKEACLNTAIAYATMFHDVDGNPKILTTEEIIKIAAKFEKWVKEVEA